jgi:hypothetical protein
MVNFYIRQNGTAQQSIYKQKWNIRFIAINFTNNTQEITLNQLIHLLYTRQQIVPVMADCGSKKTRTFRFQIDA